MVKGTLWTLLLFVALGMGVGLAYSQQNEVKNPFEGNPQAIEQGKQLYRLECSSCHGLEGRGYRGPDLTTGQWTHGGTDPQLFRVIMRGVSGTEMAGVEASDIAEDQVWMLIAYLRTLSGPGSREEERGNTQNGEALFWGKAACGQCHMINGRGGRLGPDLSRIAAARSRNTLIGEIRTPSGYLTQGYWTVTLLTQDGRRIRGTRKNEDPFSIQIMDTTEQILAFDKKDLRGVTQEERSLMPDYDRNRLTDAELDDLIRYLRALRASAEAKN